MFRIFYTKFTPKYFQLKKCVSILTQNIYLESVSCRVVDTVSGSLCDNQRVMCVNQRLKLTP